MSSSLFQRSPTICLIRLRNPKGRPGPCMGHKTTDNDDSTAEKDYQFMNDYLNVCEIPIINTNLILYIRKP
jgi:hypothetical protein